MEYLQNIKSLDAYVRMMQTFMFPMPPSERDEACQEVRQHLEALVEDFQAEGHSPDEAIRLAVERFGNPGKVGADIRDKWKAKRKRQTGVTRSTVIRRKNLFESLTLAILFSVYVWCSFVHHVGLTLIGWVAFATLGIVSSALSGMVSAYTGEIQEPPFGIGEAVWLETRARLQERQSTFWQQFSRSRKPWKKLTLILSLLGADTSLRWYLIILVMQTLRLIMAGGKELAVPFMVCFIVYVMIQKVTKMVSSTMLLKGQLT